MEGLKTLDELCGRKNLPEEDQEKAQKIIHRWHEQHGDEKGHNLNTRKMRRSDNRALKRFSIFLNNNMEMGRNSMYGQGIFPLHSRINHSCSPNVVSSYNPSINRLTVHTTRDIKAGDEALVDYGNGTFRKKSNRQAVIKSLGFVCQCRACTNPREKKLRDYMVDLKMELVLENHHDIPKTGFERSERVARSPQDALEMNEQIAALLRHPTIDLRSKSLCTM